MIPRNNMTWKETEEQESTSPEILPTCNTGRIFIWSVTSPNFHRHNVTSRSPLRHPLSSSASSRTRHQEDVLEDPRDGLSFGRFISSFALLAIDLSCWQTVRSQSERHTLGRIHYRHSVDTTGINGRSRGPRTTTPTWRSP